MKICKIHGSLSDDEIRIEKRKCGKITLRCKRCRYIANKRYYDKYGGRYKKITQSYLKDQVLNMKKPYIKQLIRNSIKNIKIKDIPESMILLKTAILISKRKTRKLRKKEKLLNEIRSYR